MAKITYEKVNKANFIPLGDVKTGEVIRWEDELYVVTSSCEPITDESRCYRRIMNITNHINFGQIEYVDENTKVDIIEDVEITIKY